MRRSGIELGLAALLVVGCSGPETSLRNAKKAIDDRDIASFEEVVDLASVVPSLLEGCMGLATVEMRADEVFEKKSPWGQLGKSLGQLLGGAVVSKMSDKLVLQVRNNFGEADFAKLDGFEGCGGITAGSLDDITFETAGKTSRAKIPVLVCEGKPATIALRLEDRGERGWMVTALELGDASKVHEACQRERVQKVAAALGDRLKAGIDAEAFKKLKVYLDNVSDDEPGAQALSQLIARTAESVISVEPPLMVEKAMFVKQRWNEYAKVTVKNPRAREVSEYSVRVEFLDKTGEIINGSFDKKAMVGRDSDGVKPNETRSASWSVNRFTWPTDRIRTAAAKVVRIKYLDGEEWTHPAYATGIWK